MDILDKDVLGVLAMELDYDDIMSLCRTSKKFNKYICENNDFWRNKFYKRFPYLRETRSDNFKNLYSSYINKKAALLRSVESQPLIAFRSRSPIIIKPELIAFLSNMDLEYRDLPVPFLLEELLEKGVLNRILLTKIFSIYLAQKDRGAKYHKTDDLMNKYLGSYLTELETDDRNKTDEEMGKLERFDRNKFMYFEIQRIFNKGIVKNPTEEQLQKLQDQETLELLSKLDEILY